MEKISKSWHGWLIEVILAMIYLWGAQNMYFHQDDLDWFLLVKRPWEEVLRYPVGDHVNYLFRLLMYLEWNWFGFNFAPYLAVSTLMHAIVIWLIYVVAKVSSGRKDLAAIAALLFSVNTNWTEVVLWISGQTISITAIFVLWAMIGIWRRRGAGFLLMLSSWTSALALGLLGATMLTYRYLRWWAMGIGFGVAMIYWWRGGDGTSLPIDLAWAGQVVIVSGLMVVNTVIGRLFIPFDRFELIRILVVVALMAYGSWRYRGLMLQIWRDTWSRFLLWQVVIYYLIVAAGRAQFGVGIMRAERYAYIGLALILILLVRVLREVKLGKWGWLVGMMVCVQVAGLYIRARGYIERPQQLKSLVETIKQTGGRELNGDDYLPRFVLNDDRLKYRDLMSLIND